MGAKPTVAFRIEADTKADWQDAVEESDEYSSLSHLITKAVNRELSGAYDVTDVPESNGVDAEVVDTVESLQERLDALEGAVRDATEAMHSADSSVSEETVTAVWQAIPESPTQATTAEGIAAGTNVEPEAARVALEQLAETTATVKRLPFEDLGEEGDDTVTATWQGREIEIEGATKAVKRRNPLFFKEV